MARQKLDRATRKLNRLLDSEFYSKVVDAWFIALNRANGNPERIMKKYIIEDGGLVHHQRFNRYFRELDLLYDLTCIKFCRRVEEVAHDYRHKVITPHELWSLYFDAISDCHRECKMALIRKDVHFFAESLRELQDYFNEIVYATDPDSRASQKCFAASVGIVVNAIYEWEAKQCSEQAKERISEDIARLLFSLDHNTGSFSQLLGSRPL